GKTAKMLRVDLADAEIDYQDEANRYFDFHALRGETASLLAASGVHPKVAQSIMRHKDINLTMSLYTHTLRGQESEAVNKLPDLSQPSKQRKSRGSGTDG
ncbi:MAG: tyrosine-type recombinase/integrase, partial [Sedimentisphaerales bacterium]